MGKRRVSLVFGAWTFFLLLASMLTSAFNIQQTKAALKTIIVPDEYPTIQAAINAANLGDMIYVRAGTYYENIVINKTVSLVGQSRETTIIDGKNVGTVIVVEADNVTIMGFRIRKSKVWYPNAGILLNRTKNCKISGNNLMDNLGGVTLSYSSNNSIAENSIEANQGWGLSLWYSSNNSITGNNITNNLGATELIDSHNNKILRNNVTNNYEYEGIWLWDSSNNVLKDNVMGDLAVMGSELSHFINDVDASNTINGKPVFYLINQQNLTITPETRPNIGYLAIVNSTNIIIKQLDIKKTFDGVLLAYTKNSLIQNVTVTNHRLSLPIVLSGIRLVSSTNNSLFGNIITENFFGIWLDKSPNNSLIKNNMTKNTEGIVLDWYSNDNIIFGNTIANNDEGILVQSNNSRIFHNNFVQNREHALVAFGYSNLWDDGYPSGGNYWSGYTGVDFYNGPYQSEIGSDGLGDTEHNIAKDNKDKYPFMAPINMFDAGIWNETSYNIDVVTNSTASDFQLNIIQKIVSFNVTGVDGTEGFCRITIPNIIVQDLWQENYTVLLNAEFWPFRNWTDATNTYIYLNYTHSEHQIIIVPEFPTTIILPLFAILSVTAVVFAKKKRKKGATPKSPFL